MKRIIALLLLISINKLQAQFSETSPGTLKIGTGYTHDFPGVNGYTIAGEYMINLTSKIQGGIGAKHVDLSGYPRTNQVQEYTKANTLDFNLYFAPLQSESQIFRVGLGYSFSFYNIKRAYPVITGSGDNKTTTWPSQINKGRTTGINLIAEYEYKIPNSLITIGLRGALYKAYGRTYFIGPMVGYRL
jgi:hypothetical protein